MIPNNNFSVLPWYTDIQLQDWRKAYAYGEVYPLFTLQNTVLPFQIVRQTRANSISSVQVYKKDGTLYENITSRMIETGLQVKRYQAYGYDVIVYYGLLPVMNTQPQGQYYAVLSDGVQTWYSDVWTVVNDISPYMKIEWYDHHDMVYDGGRVVYDGVMFRNYVYLIAELGKPDYKYEEEGEERDGLFFAEKRTNEKQFKFTILAPEYLCDALAVARLADVIKVTDKYGREYLCDTFLATPKWQEQGNLASVEIEFETPVVAKNIGRGYTIGTGGDFNNDYNNDFNNQ